MVPLLALHVDQGRSWRRRLSFPPEISIPVFEGLDQPSRLVRVTNILTHTALNPLPKREDSFDRGDLFGYQF